MHLIAILLAVVAVPTVFFSTAWAFGIGVASVAVMLFVAWGLRRMPKISFDGLSPEAQALLDRYNHAWHYPAVTRGIGSAGSVCVLAMGVVFIGALIRSQWLFLIPIALVALVAYLCSCAIFPAGHIHQTHAQDAAAELQEAYSSWMADR